MQGRLLSNRYRLDARIGAGGMGEVWRAHDGALGREVAVKIFKPQGSSADDRTELLARFRQEARAAAALDSPHIVSVYDFDSDKELPYLVMALVHGESLEELLRAEGRLPLDRTLRWAEQICDALTDAHDAGVIHRDIKPGNVMITEDDSVKVLDLGIAKFLEADENSNRLTRTGAMPIGSVLYMAPEQFRQEPGDGRLDLYALGCLLYELLIGRPPYTGPAAGVMYNHLHDTPLRPSLARAELSVSVDRLVLDLMAKDPADRPADAPAARARIAAVREGLAGTGESPGPSAPQTEPGATGVEPPETPTASRETPAPSARREPEQARREPGQARSSSAAPEQSAPSKAARPPAAAQAAQAEPALSVAEILASAPRSRQLARPAKKTLAELAHESAVVEDLVPPAQAEEKVEQLPQDRRKRAVLTGAAALCVAGVLATVLAGVGAFTKKDTYQIGVTSERVHKAVDQVLKRSHLDQDRFEVVEVDDTSSWEAVTQAHPDLVALVGNPATAKPSTILPVIRTTAVELTNAGSRDRTVVPSHTEQAERLVRHLRSRYDLSRVLLLEPRGTDSVGLSHALGQANEQSWDGQTIRVARVDGSIDRPRVREIASGDRPPEVAVLPGGGHSYSAEQLRADGFDGLIISAESHSPKALDRAGFDGRTSLPDGVLRVRSYADPANKPLCDERESWCGVRGTLPAEAGAWEEYDAARVLMTGLAETEHDKAPPLARQLLDKALTEVTAEGLLGTINYGRASDSYDNSPYGRPIWLDSSEDGRWKAREQLPAGTGSSR